MKRKQVLAKKNVSGPGVEINELNKKGVISIDFENLRILDVGFSDPGSFILLHHLYGLNKYTGVDIIKESDFRINMSFDLEIPEELCTDSNSTPFSRYKLFYKYVLTQIQGHHQNMLIEIDFERKFQFCFETTVQNYLNRNFLSEYQPNLLVLSDFLHLIQDKDEAQDLFKRLIELIAHDGIIWLKVYNSKSPESYGRFPYSQKDLDNLRSELDIIYEEEQNDKTLIVGRKK